MHLAGGVVMGAGQNHMFTLAAYSRPITSELQFRRFQLHFGLFRLQFGRRRRYQGGLLGGVEASSRVEVAESSGSERLIAVVANYTRSGPTVIGVFSRK